MPEQRATQVVPKRPTEVPTLDSYKPFASGDPDGFMAHVRAQYPELNELLELRSLEAQRAFLRGLDRGTCQRLLVMLLSLAFSRAKAGRNTEALALEQLRLEIVQLDDGEELKSYLGLSGARNRGDVLAAVGGHHQGAGELGHALSAYLEAEVWYGRDDELRRAAGLSEPTEFDRVAQQADFRSLNLATIASLYERLRDPERAVEFTKLAWKYSKRGASPKDRVMSAMSEAEGATTRGDLDLALGRYQEALKLALELRSSLTTGQDVVQVLSSMGRIYRDLRLYRRALELFERALTINQTGGHQARQQQDLENIARVYLARGDLVRAREVFERSLLLCAAPVTDERAALAFRHGDAVYQLVRLEPAPGLLLELSRLLRETDAEGAERYIRLAADVVERLRVSVFSDDARVKFQETATDIFDELVEQGVELYESSQKQGDLQKLFESIERAKSRVLVEMIADQPLPAGQLPPELLADEARLLARERDLEQRLEGSAVTLELADELNQIQQRLQQLWLRLQELPGGAEYVALRRPVPIRPDELRALLASSTEATVLLDYFCTPKRLLAIAVSSTSPQLRLVQAPIGRSELRSSVQVDAEEPPALELRLPYWQLDIAPVAVDPVRPLLEGHAHAVLVPHDVLHGLPLHALVSDSQPPIVMGCSVSYAPSASLVRYCLGRSPRRTGPALVMGAPERSDEPPLPRAADEVTAVASVLQTNAHLGPDATCERLKATAADMRCIHVVCHNQFDTKDPLASALRLSDGNLTGRDILNLNINPDLVVLAACQSGVAKQYAGDELLGLVRALLFAGAPSVVVTLWNAYDTTTKNLMVDFYRRYAGGAPKGRALAEAQREMYRAGVSAQEWATFVIVGAWR